MKSIARKAVGQWSRAGAKKDLERLRSEGGPYGARLAKVLEQVLEEPKGSSAQWFGNIEAVRETLAADQSVVEIRDFGAGGKNDQRSEQEMEQGVLVERTVEQQCNASKPAFWASILHYLLLEFRPQTGLELGTCVGISAAYQTSAMEINGSGRFITLEGAESLAEISQRNLDSLGLGERANVVPGRFLDTLDDVIADLGTIEYAFIDGHHDEHATIAYFNQFLPHLAERSVLVFDDTAWNEGMIRAWNYIKNHDAVTMSLDLGAIGIVVIDTSITTRSAIEISLRGL